MYMSDMSPELMGLGVSDGSCGMSVVGLIDIKTSQKQVCLGFWWSAMVNCWRTAALAVAGNAKSTIRHRTSKYISFFVRFRIVPEGAPGLNGTLASGTPSGCLSAHALDC